MFRLSTLLLLLPALFLVAHSKEACDGKTPTMHQMPYVEPTVYKSINITNVSKEECSKACLDDVECASAFFLAFTCYQVPYESIRMRGPYAGVLLVKVIRDSKTCSMSFNEIVDNSVKMPIVGDSRKISYKYDNEDVNVVVA